MRITMPSDKPTFFKQEDFYSQDDDYLEPLRKTIGWEEFLKSKTMLENITPLIAILANAKVAPLLQAMEIMREALIEASKGDKSAVVGGRERREAQRVLSKCDEILK